MDNNTLNVSDELLQNLSIESLAELKVEVDELASRLDNVLETCEEVLNS